MIFCRVLCLESDLLLFKFNLRNYIGIGLMMGYFSESFFSGTHSYRA